MAKAKPEEKTLVIGAQDLAALLSVAQQAQALKRGGLGAQAGDDADAAVRYLMKTVVSMARSINTQVTGIKE